MKKFRYLFEETKIGNKTFDDMELCPGAIKAFKKDYETKDNKEEILSAAQAVDDYLAIERKGLDGNIDETDLEKMKGMVELTEDIFHVPERSLSLLKRKHSLPLR